MGPGPALPLCFYCLTAYLVCSKKSDSFWRKIVGHSVFFSVSIAHISIICLISGLLALNSLTTLLLFSPTVAPGT